MFALYFPTSKNSQTAEAIKNFLLRGRTPGPLTLLCNCVSTHTCTYLESVSTFLSSAMLTKLWTPQNNKIKTFLLQAYFPIYVTLQLHTHGHATSALTYIKRLCLKVIWWCTKSWNVNGSLVPLSYNKFIFKSFQYLIFQMQNTGFIHHSDYASLTSWFCFFATPDAYIIFHK